MKFNTDHIDSLLNRLTPVLGLAIFALVAAVIHHEMRLYKWSDISTAIATFNAAALLAAVALSLLSYFILTLNDWLALEYAGERLPYPRVALAAFLSYAISNNVGSALFSGGAIRYRLYTHWDIAPGAIAKVISFSTLSYFVGALTLLLIALALPGDPTLSSNAAPAHALVLLSIFAGIGVALWWGVIVFKRRRTLHWRGLAIALPSVSLGLRQTLIAVLDLLAAALMLYLLLGQVSPLALGSFLAMYIAAQLLGLLSQVPGGIGVFESAFLLFSADHLPSAHILAALLVYRFVYYFIPLLLSGILLLTYEIRRSGLFKTKAVLSTRQLIDDATPQIFSLLLLLGGTILLISGATPAEAERLHWLKFFVPLPILELSHLAGSIAGLMLLFLANAVRSRVDSAYYAALAVLAVGIVASLFKGFDYEEAAILSVMLLALLPSRKHFYRHSALLNASLPMQWYLLVLPILLGTIWLGFFSYKHIEYSHELWWEFSLHGNASRFLRSSVAGVALLSAFFTYRLLTKITVKLELPSAEQLERAAALARTADDSSAWLALTGDKYLLWSDSLRSFVAFAATRRYWIAMGDPVGDPKEYADLVWKLREAANQSRAKVAFYQVGTRNLPIYLDIGMSMLKLGEEAKVDLADFNLQGKRRASLRTAYNKAQREGLEFAVLDRTAATATLPGLRAISERWLQHKNTREKRFSIGFFNEDYLRHCRIAIIRREDTIIAFANLWELDNRAELSIDLMRYEPDSPNGVMEFLFTSLLLWGQQQGYQRFNLGMAPLSGLDTHPLAVLWHKVGAAIYHLGGDFYNFEGLYHYKNKFDPLWQSRYLAAPPGLASASALLTVTQIIAGGIKGLLPR